MAKAAKKSAKKSSTKKASGPAQPMKNVVAFIQKAKSVSLDKVRAFLAKEYAKATVSAQMSRLSNSASLKVGEDKVTFVG